MFAPPFTRVALLFLFLLLSASYIYAQSFSHRFLIVGMSKTISLSRPHVRDSLNKKIIKANNSTEVFAAIDKQLNGYHNQLVKVMETMRDGSHRYYAYYIAAPNRTSVTIVDVTGSRDIIVETIFNKYQFSVLFSDTLAVIDTLFVEVIPANFNYAIKEYYMVIDGQKLPLPVQGRDTLVITSPSKPFFAYTLYHTTQSERSLGEGYLYFLNADDKEELLRVVAQLKNENKDNSDFTEYELAEQLIPYVCASFGRINKAALVHWLRKSN